MDDPVKLDQRGKRLHEDTLALYASMQRSKTLHAGINDISSFIIAHIPEGTSFDDAEHTLRGAGFKVFERPNVDSPHDPSWHKRNDKYHVIATLRLPSRFPSGVELMLGLRPKAPGDYTIVKEVYAAFIATFL
jgi:hypothetical protein